MAQTKNCRGQADREGSHVCADGSLHGDRDQAAQVLSSRLSPPAHRPSLTPLPQEPCLASSLFPRSEKELHSGNLFTAENRDLGRDTGPSNLVSERKGAFPELEGSKGESLRGWQPHKQWVYFQTGTSVPHPDLSFYLDG